MNLSESVILITGASSGIGQAMALNLAERGAQLALVARGKKALKATCDAIIAKGGEAQAICADVRNEQDISAMLEEALNQFGKIDVLVNNAGIMAGDIAFTDISPSQWRDIIDTNLWGAFLCSHAVVPQMIRQGRGTIINISSGAAVRTGFLNIPYGVSKAGLDRLTLGLGAELKEHGIACVSLSPSASATETVRQLYPDQDIDTWTHPPEMAARALRCLLENDPMQHTGKVLSAREYLARQENNA
jgi:NAD(P)-dependent dehydrogenase (short-subunit alcohol dehydrogenase family)